MRRQLEENDGGNDDKNDDDYYLNQNAMYSLSGYSVKYAKCQSIQRFSEEAVKNGEYNSMVKDDIVILRLCPNNSCNTNKEFGCYYNYAEYAIGISDYIRIMLRYTMDKKQKMCGYCQECFGNNYNYNNNRKLEEAEQADDAVQQGDDNQEQDDEEQQQNDDAANDNNNAANDDQQAAFDDDDYYNVDDAAAANDDGAAAGDDANANYNNDDSPQCADYQDECGELYNYCQGNNDDDAGYLQEDGYLEYLDCVKVAGQDNQYYWVKPRCDGYKKSIQMDIFYDPYCSQYAGNEINLREYSGIMFRNSIFEDYYSGTCIDCSESVSHVCAVRSSK